MTDYALLLPSPISGEGLSFKAGTQRAETLRLVSVGDVIVPLVHGGEGSDGVAHLLTVTHAPSEEEDAAGQAVVTVKGHRTQLDKPLSVAEFLRLRALDDPIAAAFQSTTPPKALMEASGPLAAAVLEAGRADRDDTKVFRRFSLVNTQDTDVAVRLLTTHGRDPLPGDGVYMFTNAALAGAATVDRSKRITLRQQPIGHAPSDVLSDLIDASARANASDAYNPEPAILALEQVVDALQQQLPVVAVDDYAGFYPFTKILQTLNSALPLLKRAVVAPQEGDSTAATSPAADVVNIAGLTVEAVLAELPTGFKVQREVVAAAVTALRAGKHLLLGGPPGTGKTTLAEALCRAVAVVTS